MNNDYRVTSLLPRSEAGRGRPAQGRLVPPSGRGRTRKGRAARLAAWVRSEFFPGITTEGFLMSLVVALVMLAFFVGASTLWDKAEMLTSGVGR